jgi:hypothetical protein
VLIIAGVRSQAKSPSLIQNCYINDMSAEALRRLRQIKALFVAAGCPDTNVWYFFAGQTGADLEELAALGAILKLLGTEHGYAWRLTDAGRAQMSTLS